MKKNDFVLAACFLLAAGVFALFLYRGDGTDAAGKEIVISVSGREIKRFSLQEDRKITIDGRASGKNTIVAEGGKVWVEEANCPDLLCKKQGAVSRAGESIVCLPNQVVVEIQGKQREGEPDAIAK